LVFCHPDFEGVMASVNAEAIGVYSSSSRVLPSWNPLFGFELFSHEIPDRRASAQERRTHWAPHGVDPGDWALDI